MCRESAICLISGDEDPKADHPVVWWVTRQGHPSVVGQSSNQGDSLGVEKKHNCNRLFFSRLLHANLGLVM